MELCWREREEEEGEREKKEGKEGGKRRREKKEGKRRLTNKQTVECGEERRAYHGILRLILMIHFCFGKELKLAN